MNLTPTLCASVRYMTHAVRSFARAATTTRTVRKTGKYSAAFTGALRNSTYSQTASQSNLPVRATYRYALDHDKIKKTRLRIIDAATSFMEEVAIILRAMQLFAHAAHNKVSGEAFFADHSFLGGLYPEYEEAYDSVVERIIGTGKDINLSDVLKSATVRVIEPTDSDSIFNALLVSESNLRDAIDTALATATTGTNNILAQLADDSETRCFKIGQRVKVD